MKVRLTSILILALLGLIVGQGLMAADAAKPSRPNVVLLISDASESTAHDTFVWHQFDYWSTKLHRYAVREGEWKLLLNPPIIRKPIPQKPSRGVMRSAAMRSRRTPE